MSTGGDPTPRLETPALPPTGSALAPARREQPTRRLALDQHGRRDVRHGGAGFEWHLGGEAHDPGVGVDPDRDPRRAAGRLVNPSVAAALRMNTPSRCIPRGVPGQVAPRCSPYRDESRPPWPRCLPVAGDGRAAPAAMQAPQVGSIPADWSTRMMGTWLTRLGGELQARWGRGVGRMHRRDNDGAPEPSAPQE
jgi:hypothetical protein